MNMAARIDIGQFIISVRSKDTNAAHVIEALRRAKFKFPGRQKIMRSNKWGFTDFDREEYVRGRKDGWLVSEGVHVKYLPEHGLPSKKNCIAH